MLILNTKGSKQTITQLNFKTPYVDIKLAVKQIKLVCDRNFKTPYVDIKLL